ncbi:trace amine-associated receptor 11 [Trichomycterus rosablanca]|uniref:trace amine-associated receptor 11 n=1 Tax=Trichomycterus rosablanca TaxID=2290929 RepID=UPI002F35BB61
MNLCLSGSPEAVAVCFESLNGSCLRSTSPLALRLSLYFLFTSIIVLTVTGNLLVIVVITFSQNHFSAGTNNLILSLSVAGLVLGGFVMPFSMVRSIESCWYFGHVFCCLHTTVDIILCNATVWHLMFISVDRYVAIFYPLHYHNRMTNKTFVAMIGSSWGLASVFGFATIISDPQVVIRGGSNKACVGGCLSLHAREIGMEYALFFYFIPVSVMMIIYGRISFIAQRHTKAIHSNTNHANPSAPSTAKDFKATKTFTIVVGNFLLCWTPFFMCNIIDPLVGHTICALLYEGLMWVAYLNATFNPLIYVFFYKWFRETAKVLLSKLFIQV